MLEQKMREIILPFILFFCDISMYKALFQGMLT